MFRKNKIKMKKGDKFIIIKEELIGDKPNQWDMFINTNLDIEDLKAVLNHCANYLNNGGYLIEGKDKDND